MADPTLRVGPHLWGAIREDLLSTPELERAGVGFAGLVGKGSSQRLLLRDWTPVPTTEYLAQLGFHLEISPAFWARASKRVRETGEAIVMLHSHPRDVDLPHFSGSDDGGENRLVPKLHARAAVPVAAVVVSPGGHQARVTRPRGRRQPLRVEIVGEPLMGGTDGIVPSRYDRQARALGTDGHAVLRALTVGVVGAGGLGSHVIQQLVHLGVGRVLVVDPDVVAESNLSRLVGASWSDARSGRSKTQVFRRLGRRVASGTRVIEVRHSVTHADGASRLLECDVIMGCTDNHWSRAVLNAIAFQYYVPVMDMGVELQASGAAGGRIAWLAPGCPCLWCLGVLDPERVRVEQLPHAAYEAELSRGYVERLDDPAPAVVSINGVIASLGVTELLARLTGFAGDQPRPMFLLYRLRDGVVRRTAATPGSTCPTCSLSGLLGVGELGAPPWFRDSENTA